jgi:hypothetical protein
LPVAEPASWRLPSSLAAQRQRQRLPSLQSPVVKECNENDKLCSALARRAASTTVHGCQGKGAGNPTVWAANTAAKGRANTGGAAGGVVPCALCVGCQGSNPTSTSDDRTQKQLITQTHARERAHTHTYTRRPAHAHENNDNTTTTTTTTNNRGTLQRSARPSRTRANAWRTRPARGRARPASSLSSPRRARPSWRRKNAWRSWPARGTCLKTSTASRGQGPRRLAGHR